MSEFIKWLESLNAKDTKVRAVLRRSLAFDPGRYIQAIPYVEPFVKGANDSWRREVLYMVAGLWAMHWKEDYPKALIPIGKACALFDSERRKVMGTDEKQKLTSTEKRFITLLDADSDQLPHRLRQMVALLKEQPLDFDHMLTGLLYWNDDQKRTQNSWARDFYRNLNSESEPTSQEENAA